MAVEGKTVKKKRKEKKNMTQLSVYEMEIAPFRNEFSREREKNEIKKKKNLFEPLLFHPR